MEAAVMDREAGMTEWSEGRLDELGQQVHGIAQRVDEGIVQLNRVDERVEQLDKKVDQLDSRIGRFESQVNDRFGRVESGISQIQNQFRELQHTLVQMTWGLAIALLIVLGSVIAA
ncbi:MAG: hypothetical protein M3Y75_12555 [Actinomycetota bacterium]|nr:hypothetical protein [Actinomycetota bacterium]